MPAKAKKTTTKPVAETINSLAKQVVKLREEALTLKRNTLTGDVQNVRAYKYKRKELARTLTKLNQLKSKEEK